MEDFDLQEYVKDGRAELKGVRIENRRLSGRQCEASIFIRCVFNNVVFDRQFENDEIYYEECEFVNCVFHGSLGKSYLVLRDNLLKDCVFENVSMEFGGELSDINGNGFFDCSFKNVKLAGDAEFLSQTIKGGKIEDAYLLSTNMTQNQFLDLRMENVQMLAAYSDNVMASVVFRNVTLKRIADVYQDDSIFYQCDTAGLKFIEHEW